MKRVNLDRKADAVVPVHLAAVESVVLEKLPEIISHLTHTRYEDGTPRQTGTVTLRTRGSSWCAEARDFDACARLICVANSADDALALLDLLLGSDNAPWEPDRFLLEKQPKKPK